MPLLDSNDATPIRKAIDLGLTEAACPWELIEQDIYKGMAEDWVARSVDVDGLSADELVHARRAAVLFCASLLANTVNIPTSDSVGGVGASYTRKVMEPAANSRRLLGLAERELALLTEEDEISEPLPRSGSVKTQAVW